MTNTAQPTKQCPGCGATTMRGYCDTCLDAPPAPSGRVTTQTGIWILPCQECRKSHPINRSHCNTCGAASAFIDPDTGNCHRHKEDK